MDLLQTLLSFFNDKETHSSITEEDEKTSQDEEWCLVEDPNADLKKQANELLREMEMEVAFEKLDRHNSSEDLKKLAQRVNAL